MKTDEDLIAEAVAAGRVRRFPQGATSGWDERPLREQHAVRIRNRYWARQRADKTPRSA